MFVCSKCGECCRHIDLIPQLAEFDTGNGVCIHLKGDCCSIYSTRPEICRIDEMYDKYFFKLYTRDDYYQINMGACHKLMEIKKEREKSYGNNQN